MWEVHIKDAFKYKKKSLGALCSQCSHVFVDRSLVIWESFVMYGGFVVGKACKHRCN
jgi:hypothetical protein